jgi:hypothetical protein
MPDRRFRGPFLSASAERDDDRVGIAEDAMKRGDRLEAGEAIAVAKLSCVAHPLLVADLRAIEMGLSLRVFQDPVPSDR